MEMKYIPVYLNLCVSAGLSLYWQFFELVRNCGRDFLGKISYIGG